MDFVILFGPPAVGKVTIGYELSRLTGIPLFHNHMTIDLLTPFFPYGAPPSVASWASSGGGCSGRSWRARGRG